jgi:hypothetical protein
MHGLCQNKFLSNINGLIVVKRSAGRPESFFGELTIVTYGKIFLVWGYGKQDRARFPHKGEYFALICEYN